MPQLRLSAVMPNFNHAEFLPGAIEGILQQTRPPDEFLILDDASTDRSAEIIQSYADRFPLIRFIRNTTNQGVIAAHEQLFRMATGDWLYSGAADDDRLPDFFRRAMEMAEEYPSSGLVFGKMVTINAAGEELGTVEPSRWLEPVYASPQRYRAEYLDVEPPFQAATAATIFRRAALAEVGWFPADLRSFADTFAVRAIAFRHGACYVPERFCRWRKMPGSVSQTVRSDALRTLDIVSRAAARMKSEAFRDRFPADYVEQWERAARGYVLRNYLAGDEDSRRKGFLVRNLSRLRRIPGFLALVWRIAAG